MRKIAVVACSAVAAVSGFVPVSPARAATTVHLAVSVTQTVPLATCDVAVVDGASGVDVLNAAQASGCIDSYEVRDDGFLWCINGICTTPDETMNILYWAIYIDSGYSLLGLRDLHFPENGGTLSLSYETWATFFVPQP